MLKSNDFSASTFYLPAPSQYAIYRYIASVDGRDYVIEHTEHKTSFMAGVFEDGLLIGGGFRNLSSFEEALNLLNSAKERSSDTFR